jgi:Zn finger protein HypA/HybF involved in hydrogenase expression
MSKYTIDQLKQAVAKSTSFAMALRNLNVSDKGGNIATIKRKVANNNIDTSHFTGAAWCLGRQQKLRTDISVYLENKMPIGSFRLKNRLVREGYMQCRCSHCNSTEWLGNPIPLELDHIDGNSSNNALQNLRLLCPNCHALTPTYRGKNQGRAK